METLRNRVIFAVDFDLIAGAHDRILVQFQPFLADTVFRKLPGRFAAGTFVTHPAPKSAARLDTKLDWLVQISADPAQAGLAMHLLDLVLVVIAASGQQAEIPPDLSPGAIERIKPDLRWFIRILAALSDCPMLPRPAM